MTKDDAIFLVDLLAKNVDKGGEWVDALLIAEDNLAEIIELENN